MTTCIRSWEVEALRDGRLGGDARMNAERHIESCEVCSAEQRAFDALATKLGDAAPRLDQLALRRLRNRVLARAHGEPPVPVRGRSRAPWMLAAASMVAGGVGIAALAVRSGGPDRMAYHLPDKAVGSGRELATEIEPSEDAAWSRVWEPQRNHEIERVRLWRGALALHNRRAASDTPLIVTLPDGEIEDIGTRFRVVVTHDRTVDIAVTEGRVRFTPNGGEPIVLEAGGEWHAPVAAVVTDGIAADPTPPVARAQASNAVRAPAASAPLASDGAANTQDEDAAYLHILALAREGRRDEAALAAGQYLARFPKGFRRIEVEQIRERSIGSESSQK